MIKTNKEIRALNGIDTLYYFVDTDFNNYTTFYDELQLNIDNDIFKYDKMFYLGTSQGFHWFNYSFNDVSIARIGFKNYVKQRNVKDIYVQLEGETIYYNGLKDSIKLIDDYLISINIKSIEKYVSRVDLNIFTNVNFENLDTDWISTRSRKEAQIFTIQNGRKIETIYFGNRASGKVLRIYNKKNEMKKDINKPKNVYLLGLLKKHKIIDDLNSELWNVELELHRKHLKKHYDINTLQDFFDKIYSIWYDELMRFRILKKDLSKLKYLDKNKDKLLELSSWLYLKNYYVSNKTFDVGIKNKRKPYKMTKLALCKQTMQLLDKYNSFLDNNEELLNVNEFLETFMDYASTELYNNDDFIDYDDYKFIPLEKFDKWGLLRKKDFLLRPFYQRVKADK